MSWCLFGIKALSACLTRSQAQKGGTRAVFTAYNTHHHFPECTILHSTLIRRLYDWYSLLATKMIFNSTHTSFIYQFQRHNGRWSKVWSTMVCRRFYISVFRCSTSNIMQLNISFIVIMTVQKKLIQAKGTDGWQQRDANVAIISGSA